MVENPNAPKSKRGKNPGKPILRAEIEEAQRNTNSNTSAAKWMGIGYNTYRKYAKLYNLFDSHLNPTGIGIDKGWGKKPSTIPIREILEGKHPKYSLAKLKNRLIARKKLEKKCYLCGFNEERITDKQVPLMLSFKDGNRTNMALDNLELLCYNCMFLTTGAPSVVYRKQIKRSFVAPHTIPTAHQVKITTVDYLDMEDAELNNITLTDEEKQALLNEN